LATQLAPARPHVIDVNKHPELFDLSVRSNSPRRALPSTSDTLDLVARSNSPWSQRPSTSHTLRKKETSIFQIHPQPPSVTEDDQNPGLLDGPGKTQALKPSFSQASIASNTSRTPSRWSAYLRNYQSNMGRHASVDTDTSLTEADQNIINGINDAVNGFPQSMLFLDTPCVVEMRRQGHSKRPSVESRISPRSSESQQLSDESYRSSSRRRTRTSSLFAPFRLGSSRKTSSISGYAPSVSAIPEPPIETEHAPAVQPVELPPPNVAALRRIFPSTDDWWRNVLYAHLVAYNYIRRIQSLSKQSRPGIPPKVSQTLGIPRTSSNNSLASLRAEVTLDRRLKDIEVGLESCIQRITNCMAGNSNALRDTEEVRMAENSDGVLVRTLAEVVALCEGAGA
jgi:hypothetical protein